MNEFEYQRAVEPNAAIDLMSGTTNIKFLAGGTNLLDLIKLGFEQPAALIDIYKMPLAEIEELSDGTLRLGAAARNSDTAYHPLVQERYPVLSEAILSGASAQLRNMATLGGNLMQRTRCYYFYDTSLPCNKRKPNSGCGAINGFNRMHAVLGTSENCIATHPSDMCVALTALDAVVNVRGKNGERAITLIDFHRLPGDTPHLETALEHGELITSIDLPPSNFAARSHYVKVRDRTSYAFATCSVAAALSMQNNVIADARIAFGGIATKPWRSAEAEKALIGETPNEILFRGIAEVALKDAAPRQHNAFKIELAKRTLVRALNHVVKM